jgi:hypothetical protein
VSTERGQYRFTVKETGHGTYFLAAEPAGDTLKGLYGLLGIHLAGGDNAGRSHALRRRDEQ